MTLLGIVESDYGGIIELTVTDAGTAVDISSYTTRQFKFLTPSGTLKTKTATLKTDGTDGKLQYTLASGDIDAPGAWYVQVYLASATRQLSSVPLAFTVERRLK